MHFATHAILDRERIQQVTTEKGFPSYPISMSQPYTTPIEIAPGGIVYGVIDGQIIDVSLVREKLPGRRCWGPACNPRINLDTYVLASPVEIVADLAELFPNFSTSKGDCFLGKLADYEMIFPVPKMLGECLWNLVSDQAGLILNAASSGRTITDFLDQQAMFEILARSDLSTSEKRRYQDAFLQQGEFRAAVESLLPICPITGEEEGLEICRIIPWHLANDAEKLDPNNALLMRPSLIDEFVWGMIHFEPNGYIQVSSRCGFEAFGGTEFPAADSFPLWQFNADQQRYLARHADETFIGH